MFRNYKNTKNTKNTGFTLIELLVVIAIIGVLAGVILASLNTAREKAKIAAIKSTLKSMQSQAEITYSETGSYSSLFTYNANLNCIGPLASMAQSLTEKGVIVKCFSSNNPSLQDVYQRFGASAMIPSTNELKAWSVSENGVVKWDTKGVDTNGIPLPSGDDWGSQDGSIAACSKSGGRLPSIEEAVTLISMSPSGFDEMAYWGYGYWSSTKVPVEIQNNNWGGSGTLPAGYLATMFSYNGMAEDAGSWSLYRCTR